MAFDQIEKNYSGTMADGRIEHPERRGAGICADSDRREPAAD